MQGVAGFVERDSVGDPTGDEQAVGVRIDRLQPVNRLIHHRVVLRLDGLRVLLVPVVIVRVAIVGLVYRSTDRVHRVVVGVVIREHEPAVEVRPEMVLVE